MKRMIITDPCYLISDRDWIALCDACLVKKDDYNKFLEMLADLLRVVSGDEKAILDSTGFGDWSNEIGNKDFYADSGLVCVVEHTDKLDKYLDKENVDFRPDLLAEVEYEMENSRRIDTSNPEWSVVRLMLDGEPICSLETEEVED